GKEVYSVDKESMDLDLDNEKAKIWVKNTVNISKPKLNDVVEVKTYFDIRSNIVFAFNRVYAI
ncbi:hypothetical protein ACT453_31635, partial [Bacillus sp. D-CC]